MDTQALRAPDAPATASDPTLVYRPGTRVHAALPDGSVSATVTGFDYKGRAVLDVRGARRICSHDALALAGPPADARSVLASLPAGAVVVPPARLGEALDAALDVTVNGTHTAREFTDAFRARGYEVFVVGGGVRDAIRVLQQQPNATRADLLAVLNDIDIVTTAPPPVARAICESVAPELAGGGVWSPKFVEQFGVVLAGGKKAGQKDSEGLDICALKSGSEGKDMVVHADTGEKAFPNTFGADLMADARARDFCCNALYYDPHHKVVVDPTLQGIADAERSLLHPVVGDARTGPGDVSVVARFWKFRLRGFTSDGETLSVMRKWAQAVFSTRTGKERWLLQNALGRTAPKDASTRPQVEAWLSELRRIMHEDRCADLFDRALHRGVREGVIAEVLKRTTKGLTPPAPSTTDPQAPSAVALPAPGGDG